MILLPAIDLYEGKVVRLTRGDYGNMTVYRDDPAAQAADAVGSSSLAMGTKATEVVPLRCVLPTSVDTGSPSTVRVRSRFSTRVRTLPPATAGTGSARSAS